MASYGFFVTREWETTVQLGAIWTPVVSVGSLDGLASVES